MAAVARLPRPETGACWYLCRKCGGSGSAPGAAAAPEKPVKKIVKDSETYYERDKSVVIHPASRFQGPKCEACDGKGLVLEERR